MKGQTSLLAGLTSLALCTAANATTLSFDAGVPSTTSYTEAGVTFTAGGQLFGTFTSPNGTPALLADGSPRSSFLAVLAAPASSVSVDLGDFDADPDLIFLDAYNASNVLLGSTSLLLDAPDSTMHMLSLSFAGITSVQFGSTTPSVNGSSVFADNFTFNGGAVPEPATWAMMLLGFAAVGFSIRRRRLMPKLVG